MASTLHFATAFASTYPHHHGSLNDTRRVPLYFHYLASVDARLLNCDPYLACPRSSIHPTFIAKTRIHERRRRRRYESQDLRHCRPDRRPDASRDRRPRRSPQGPSRAPLPPIPVIRPLTIRRRAASTSPTCPSAASRPARPPRQPQPPPRRRKRPRSRRRRRCST